MSLLLYLSLASDLPSFQPSLINWSPPNGLSCIDCLAPDAAPTETTRYSLSLSDENNCSWSGEVLVTVALPNLYVPNAFSPNGDGNNDTFAPVLNDGVAAIASFALYDRWGVQVFSMTDDIKSWDGFFQGEPAQQGIYVFSVEWIDLAGNIRNEMGEVLLLR